MRIVAIPTLIFLFVSITQIDVVNAQTVSVGKGSYSTTLPAGAVGPSTISGLPAVPKISTEFNQLVNTNDYWSSLIFPRQENKNSNAIYAHPLTIQAKKFGFRVGHISAYEINGIAYNYPIDRDLEISLAGQLSNRTSAHSYGDWSFTAKMEYDNASLLATTGHGLPYIFFEVSEGEVQIAPAATPDIWHNENEVIGMSVNGKHYGLFAPSGSIWSGSDTLNSALNDIGFLSVAILPDSTSQTLEFFRSHAYAQVINSIVSWNYDEVSSDLNTTFTYETILRDSSNGNSDETLTALYRHQWINTAEPLTNYSYVSPRGEMKLIEGNSFTTSTRFSGILPSLPDLGEYNRIQLLEYVQDVAKEILPITDTYNNGKQMGRFSELVHIADQLGAIAERDYFLDEIKLRLEDWFTTGGAQEYSYNETWNTLTGYPASFGSDREINDHHFHAAYAIKSAATIAQYDSAWASQENWGGMVNLLIRDANNWNHDDEILPFLRNFDPYAGHAWASGHADFLLDGIQPGNNQESSSESMNFNSATILWGEITGQKEIRDLGIFLYTNEKEAIDQYWFDVDNEVFPEEFPYNAVGRVWGVGADHTTWFSSEPEFVRGINFLPINSGSFYLGANPDYILQNYNELVNLRGGQPIHWKDIFWQYLSMTDPDLALSYYNLDLNYVPFDGESRAHTLHWLYNMKEMGQFSTEITADIPTYAVFVDSNNDTTYNAFNASSKERLVSFSDGFIMTVPANSLIAYQTGEQIENIPEAPLPTVESNKVISIFSDSYPSFVGADFNPQEGQNTNATIVVIDGNNTLKFDSLDYQSILLSNSISVASRDTFHIDYFTGDATSLQITLIGSNQSESVVDLSISTDSWQQAEIPLTSLSDSLDLNNLSKLFFSGNGTFYIDNIFFSGETIVEIGPAIGAPIPLSDPVDVISVFSDSYDNIIVENFNPDWNQQTEVSFVNIDGNNTLKYSNLNYQGTQFLDPEDVSEMEWIHFDYWTENTTNLQLSLISPGNPALETPVAIDLKQNSWQSIDIPLSEYAEVVNLAEVFQLKFEGDGTIFLDNLYFAKLPDLTAAPTPIHDASDVVSLFSNAYDNVTVDTWSAPWDQADVEDVLIDGNDAKFYSNVNFVGIEFTSETIDGTDLTHMHFDIWTADPAESASSFRVKLVDFGENGVWSGGDDVEHELSFDTTTTPSLVSKEWMSFDIPLDDFVNMTTREHLAQILFVSRSVIDEFYLDNLYFYTSEVINSDENENIDIPQEVLLQQNYPNPFNPSTNIEFSIPKSSDVSLLIYNSIGQLVSTIVDSQLSAGTYTVKWDASKVASGIYYYQLQADDKITTKQMLLIK